MGKIKITENELKQLICESVVDVLNEKRSMWDDMNNGISNLANRAMDRRNSGQIGLGGTFNNVKDAWNSGKNFINRVKDSYSNYDTVKAQNTSYVQEIDKLTKEIQGLRTEKNQIEQNLAKANSKLAAANKKIAQLTKTNQDLTIKNQQLANRVSNTAQQQPTQPTQQQQTSHGQIPQGTTNVGDAKAAYYGGKQ